MIEHLPFAVTVGRPEGKRIARFEAARNARTFARDRSGLLVGQRFCVVDTSVAGGRCEGVYYYGHELFSDPNATF